MRLLVIIFLSRAIAWPDPELRTQGYVWPQPQQAHYSKTDWAVSNTFAITKEMKCDILDKAINRYQKIIGLSSRMGEEKPVKVSTNEVISSLHISIKSSNCPLYPTLGMVESYTLSANTSHAVLTATEVWGALRGLESFSQLFFFDGENKRFRPADIGDYPRFPHRGLLVDTSRHFYSVDILKAIIDMCAMNKLNVFHWHIVDNEAFPYASKVYPEFAKGAYDSNHIYSLKQIKEVIDFSRLRGVRVIPEFDTPGHVASWRKGLDFMTTRCFDKKGEEGDVRDRGMLDVSNPLMWDALVALFKEVFNLFPDEYVHLGGDETEYWMENCWANNKNISNFMKIWNLNSTRDLEQWYFDRLFKHLGARDIPEKTFIVWQEVLDMGIKLSDNVVGHVWKGKTEDLSNVTARGNFAILSSCWYLDHISWNIDYKEFYACDPQNFEGSDIQKKLVLGGEAAMWGEMVDASNAIQRIFPRASATAEKLWSDKTFTKRDPDEVWPRLQEMQCRMVRRGYPAQPAYGPSYCETEYQPKLPNWED